MRSFASDNNSSVHPRIMEALMKANNGHALGYGDDPWTKEAAHKVKELFHVHVKHCLFLMAQAVILWRCK